MTIAVTDDASKKVTFEARGDVPAISGNHIEGFKVSNRETSLLPKMGGNGTKICVQWIYDHLLFTCIIF